MKEKYYECHLFYEYKEAQQRLLYKPLLGSERMIPIILVNDNGNIFEFFTKTKFEQMGEGYGTYFSLPNSTLKYYRSGSYCNYYREILPADALKILQPYMNKSLKYVKTIEFFFAWFRADYQNKQALEARRNKENVDAQFILAKFLEKK